MAIETTLIACKNAKWFTAKKWKVDESGKPVLDGSGNEILVDLTDESGNPVKLIHVECQWSHLGDDTQDFLGFVANPADPETHGRNLYADLVAGKYGTVADEE